MPNLRLVCAALIALAAALSVTAGASAAQKAGCPAAEGWGAWEVDAAAAEIFPNLLGNPYQSVDEFADYLDATFDKNGDDVICVKIFKGEDLNPNSKWYIVGVDLLGSPTTFNISRDNTANATHG